MLPKTNRLILSDKKYKELRETGQTTFTKEAFFITSPKENKTKTKFAIVVPKKLDKRAERRNRTRRLIATIIQKKLRKIKNGYEVMIVVKRIFNGKLEEAAPIVNSALRKAGLLKTDSG